MRANKGAEGNGGDWSGGEGRGAEGMGMDRKGFPTNLRMCSHTPFREKWRKAHEIAFASAAVAGRGGIRSIGA